jgi:hypothetical protein
VRAFGIARFRVYIVHIVCIYKVWLTSLFSDFG